MKQKTYNFELKTQLEEAKKRKLEEIKQLKHLMATNKADKAFKMLKFISSIKESNIKLKKFKGGKPIFTTPKEIYYNVYRNLYIKSKDLNISTKTLKGDSYLIVYDKSLLRSLNRTVKQIEKQIRRL